MQAARHAPSARQRNVERLGAQLHRELFIGELLAPLGQGRLDGLLGDVDRRAAGLLFVHAQGRHALHQFGDATGFAEKLRLRVLEFGGRLGFGKGCTCGLDQGVQLVHGKNFEVKKKRAGER